MGSARQTNGAAMKKREIKTVRIAEDIAGGISDRDPSQGHVVVYSGDYEYFFHVSRAGLRRLHRQIGSALGEPPPAVAGAKPRSATSRNK
jgi:hypothetical protein